MYSELGEINIYHQKQTMQKLGGKSWTIGAKELRMDEKFSNLRKRFQWSALEVILCIPITHYGSLSGFRIITLHSLSRWHAIARHMRTVALEPL
jgi:hypothetical protein